MRLREILNEQIKVTNSNIMSYLKLIQKALKSNKFDVEKASKAGAWVVHFDNVSFLFKNVTKKNSALDVALLIGFNTDGSKKFVRVPTKVKSIKDLQRYATILDNMKGSGKGTPKTITQLIKEINLDDEDEIGIAIASDVKPNANLTGIDILELTKKEVENETESNDDVEELPTNPDKLRKYLTDYFYKFTKDYISTFKDRIKTEIRKQVPSNIRKIYEESEEGFEEVYPEEYNFSYWGITDNDIPEGFAVTFSGIQEQYDFLMNIIERYEDKDSIPYYAMDDFEEVIDALDTYDFKNDKGIRVLPIGEPVGMHTGTSFKYCCDPISFSEIGEEIENVIADLGFDVDDNDDEIPDSVEEFMDALRDMSKDEFLDLEKEYNPDVDPDNDDGVYDLEIKKVKAVHKSGDLWDIIVTYDYGNSYISFGKDEGKDAQETITFDANKAEIVEMNY